MIYIRAACIRVLYIYIRKGFIRTVQTLFYIIFFVFRNEEKNEFRPARKLLHIVCCRARDYNIITLRGCTRKVYYYLFLIFWRLYCAHFSLGPDMTHTRVYFVLPKSTPGFTALFIKNNDSYRILVFTMRTARISLSFLL